MENQLSATNMAGIFGLSPHDMIHLLGLNQASRKEHPEVALTAFARMWNRSQSWIGEPDQFVKWFTEEKLAAFDGRTAFEAFAEPRGPWMLERYLERISV